MKKPIPTSIERTFLGSNMFFSTTDKTGLILNGNSVFQKISGYTQEELIHAPHNIIRHPDMPKAVFKLLWDTIQSNQPICAYVKNMAKDGAYYWVYATVFPIKEGYLSIRIKPQSATFETVKGLYAKALQEEQQKGVIASTQVILEAITSLGFDSYQSFMTSTLVAELEAKDLLERKNSADNQENAQFLQKLTSNSLWKKTYYLLSECKTQTAQSFNEVRALTNFRNQANEATTQIHNSFKKIRTLSINMSLSSNHLGRSANTLSVISNAFHNFSNVAQSDLNEFDNISRKVQESIYNCTFKLAAAYLQSQMVHDYFKEILIENYEGDPRNEPTWINLFDISRTFIEGAHQELTNGLTHLRILLEITTSLENSITSLESIRQTGKVEMIQIPGGTEAIGPYLDQLGMLIIECKKPLENILDITFSVRESINFFNQKALELSKLFI